MNKAFLKIVVFSSYAFSSLAQDKEAAWTNFVDDIILQVFEHRDYGGCSDGYTIGRIGCMVDPKAFFMQCHVRNDEISSYKIKPGYKVTFFQHCPYGGERLVAKSDNAWVGEFWNDQISSFIIEKINPDTPRPPDPNTNVKENPMSYINGFYSSISKGTIQCHDYSYRNSHPSKKIKLIVKYTGSLFDDDCSGTRDPILKELLLSPGETRVAFNNIGSTNIDFISAGWVN